MGPPRYCIARDRRGGRSRVVPLLGARRGSKVLDLHNRTETRVDHDLDRLPHRKRGQACLTSLDLRGPSRIRRTTTCFLSLARHHPRDGGAASCSWMPTAWRKSGVSSTMTSQDLRMISTSSGEFRDPQALSLQIFFRAHCLRLFAPKHGAFARPKRSPQARPSKGRYLCS